MTTSPNPMPTEQPAGGKPENPTPDVIKYLDTLVHLIGQHKRGRAHFHEVTTAADSLRFEIESLVEACGYSRSANARVKQLEIGLEKIKLLLDEMVEGPSGRSFATKPWELWTRAQNLCVALLSRPKEEQP
jgi:hypothetical protein